MSWLATALTILGLWLNAKRRVSCWPVWIGGNVVWLAVYYPQGDYAVCAVNAVMLGMNLAGWRSWSRN